MRTGDTPADERRRLVAPPARPPDHHARVALPDAHLAGPGDAARRRGGDHRRDPRPGRHQAGRPPRAHARAARRPLPSGRRSASACRPPSARSTRSPASSAARGDPADRRPRPRPVTIVDAGIRKPLEIEVVVPVEDMGELGEVIDEPASGPAAAGAGAPQRSGRRCTPACSSWSQEHRSTLIFVNARRLAERLATRLNELAAERRDRRGSRPSAVGGRAIGAPPAVELVKAHHGSLSRERRLHDRGRAQGGPAEGPGRHVVARARHRHGRGRPRRPGRVARLGGPRACSASAGPATRSASRAGASSSPSTAATWSRRRSSSTACTTGSSSTPATPATRSTCWPSRSWPCARSTTGRSTSSPPWCAGRPTSPSCPTRCSPPCSTCSPGRYPSDEFAELRPRIVWDRVDGIVRGRAGAQRLAVTSGGTIPDRGLFGVFLPDGTRVGELDEEMVYESRPGETFLLGASHLAHRGHHPRAGGRHARAGPAREDAVLARRRARPPARAGPGGRRVRPRRSARCRATEAIDRLQRRPRPRRAGRRATCSQYLDEQAEATRRGARRPHDRRRAVPRRDRRLAGLRAHAVRRPGPRARGRWRCRPGWPSGWGIDVELMWSDDGIVLRLPEAVDELPARRAAHRPRRDRRPRRRPAARTPRCSRRGSASARPGPCCCPAAGPTGARRCGSSASGPPTCSPSRPSYPTFPILLETTRECLQRRVRPARAARGARATCASRKVRVVAGRHARGRRRSPSRCCSAGSPSTCTRATRRWPSAGPRRSRSTATCCASCSAPRSCAS